MPRKIHDWVAVQQYYDLGHRFVECRRRFEFSHTAWIKAIKRGQLLVAPSRFSDRRRKYDWSEVQAYYDEGHSYRECREKFGFNSQAWYKARQRAEIKPRHQGMPIADLLVGARCRTHLKGRLIRAGLLENRCAECGLTEWRGRSLSIHLDHINGVRGDNRLENLRMLCPNCHSQTETYSGRNLRRRSLHEQG